MWHLCDQCAAYILSKRGDSVSMQVSQLSEKIKQMININERNGRTLSKGKSGALSTQNLFHLSFSSAQRLRTQSPNSCGQHTYNWLQNQIQSDRQASPAESFLSQTALGDEPSKIGHIYSQQLLNEKNEHTSNVSGTRSLIVSCVRAKNKTKNK